jgi:L,D-transpeptidase ErfK/SrfK
VLGNLVMLPRLLVVDRSTYTLDIYQWKLRKLRYQNTHTFLVTVGKEGSRTPHGLYFVENRTREPDWKIPIDPDYDPDAWGTTIPYGADGNPFANGFISLGGKEFGIGIHDTTFEPKVGTDSSHGCIRMLTVDFLEIYDLCPIGTPVYLH